MLINVLIMAGLVVLVGLLTRLTLKAGRLKRAVFKWPAVLLSGLLTLAFLAVTVVAALGYFRMNFSPYRHEVSDVQVDITPERVERGEHLAYICTDCHSTTMTLPLDGGGENILAGDLPLGELYATNLTPGGPLKDWTDGEIIRAIREGVDENGRPLVVMPSMAMHNSSDEDAAALVAYLRSQPAVDQPSPERKMSVLAALLIGAGMFPTSVQTPITEVIVAPEPGTAEYGAYLAASLGCADCHGADMTGIAPSSFGPAGPNLTAIVPKWSEAEFFTLFREGKDPSGRLIDPLVMPWKSYNHALVDEDLKSIYLYMNSLEYVEMSER